MRGQGAGALEEAGLSGEVVGAEQRQRCGSPRIAADHGARVVHVARARLRQCPAGGIGAARGRYIVMADADDSYDFLEVPKFVGRLREGFDLVQGCRLAAEAAAYERRRHAVAHEWLGNPLSPPWPADGSKRRSRVYAECARLHTRSVPGTRAPLHGQEFATEMIIKAACTATSISEVPVTFTVDGRLRMRPPRTSATAGTSALLLMFRAMLFLVPASPHRNRSGRLCGGAAAPSTWGVNFDAHTLLFASLASSAGTSHPVRVFTKASRSARA